MSTAIASVNYDPKTATLNVSFVKGGSMSYPDVPPSVAEAFQADPSGEFFNKNIRNNY